MVRFITDPRQAPTGKSALLVIGAGLPRTATSSLQAALEELGFDPCLHMAQIIPHADRQQLLLDAEHEKDPRRRQKLIHQLVDGYAAVCDMPAIFFLSDLMDLFPDAKVVLSVRPRPDTWAKSCFDSLSFFFTRQFYWIGFWWKTDRLWYQLNMHILDWCKEKHGETDIFTGALYERYNESVRKLAQDRGREVLEFKAEDGWRPLCEYLDKDIPNAEFPRVNEKRTFAIIKGIVVTKGLLTWAAVGGIAWFGGRYALSVFSLMRPN
ncbi:uncharacterized protein N7482_003590 [Penicillium canariense]|uniref:NAD dependent epimerase/dehydratase n=1 Tax=Penicillium canariense TaxID=189055 RepID=A0A9W9LPA6_9EURO|nr:uncharacterized protein N7482_003590 [Penicillium canariense]KAJ5167996.1 hypothetical protein N7482_003590 [Penicillium canariense]